jgi:hypothetical protein
MRKKAKLPPAEAGGSFAVKVRTDKLEFGKQKAPLLKGAVSLKADWRIHPAQDESESHHRLRAVPLPLTREAKTVGGGDLDAPQTNAALTAVNVGATLAVARVSLIISDLFRGELLISPRRSGKICAR